MRRLPGPAGRRLSDGVQTPEALFELFRDWQKNTYSIFGDGSSEPETANECPVLQECRNHQPRGTSAQQKIPINPVRALLSAPSDLAFSLDK